MENINNIDNELIDILGAIELPDEIIKKTETNFVPPKMVTTSFTIKFKKKEIPKEILSNNKNIVEKIKTESRLLKQFINTSIFWIKYIFTSVTIFGVLLVSTNFSAYSNIIESYLFQEDNKKEAISLLNSANAWKIEENNIIYKKTKAERIEEFKEKTKKVEKTKTNFSMKQIISEIDKKNIDLWIEFVPYENRIVIPKIGKNIPLIDVKEKFVESKEMLDNILMKELEDGIVRYPGTAKPWEKGNSFIFGHSSNFPWVPGDYNEVFARLWQLEVWDIVFSYYDQKKYKYRVVEKKVVKTTDIGVLKNDETKKELTLMTCWPIGTTLNRLIIKTELIEE